MSDILYQAYLLKQLRKYSTKSSERIRNAKCYPIDVSLMNAGKDAFAKDNFGWRLESLVYPGYAGNMEPVTMSIITKQTLMKWIS